MNPKIKKTRDELERTKAKILDLQALVPRLEKSITDMENTEIIKAVRSADIAPAELPAFLAALKNSGTKTTEPAETAAPAPDVTQEQEGTDDYSAASYHDTTPTHEEGESDV